MLEAPQALNFSLRLGDFLPGRQASPSVLLEPNASVAGTAEEDRAAKYEFDLPSAEASAQQLRVRKCYGKMRFLLQCIGAPCEKAEAEQSLTMGPDVLLPLPRPTVKRAAEPGRARAILEPLPADEQDGGPTNCSFEIALLQSAANSSGGAPRLGAPILSLEQPTL